MKQAATSIIPSVKADHLSYKPALDIIRFLAAFWVILGHAKAVQGADHGVTLFFVLSGYLIGGQLIHEKEIENKIDFKEFYFKRITRIWPPYFLALAFYLLIFFLRGQNHVEGFYLPMIGSLTYTYNLVNEITREINPTWVSFNQIWSLSIEEQFYLVVPLFISLSPQIMVLPLCFFLLIISGWYAPLYAGLFCGIISAQILKRFLVVTPSGSYSNLAIFISVILFIIIFWIGQGESLISFSILLLSTLLIMISTVIRIDKKFHPVIRYIGLMTYSSYLLHGIPIYFLSPIYRYVANTTTTPIWFNVLCGISSLFLSYLCVKKIELPILAWRKNQQIKHNTFVNYAPTIAWSLGFVGLIFIMGLWISIYGATLSL